MPSARAQPTLIAVGASAGGIAALSALLGGLSRELQTPIVIALHTQGPDMQPLLTILGQRGGRSVVEAQPGLRIEAGKAYLAPGGYHLLVERDQTLSLSVDERVCHARPSIDVLFESVAHACAETAIGVVLTGLNADGAQGLARIRATGGVALVQDPDSAEFAVMPRAALAATAAESLTLAQLSERLNALCRP